MRVVTIDGWSGSGKTALTKNIGQTLGLTHYQLDDFLHENRGGYLKEIDYSRLSESLTSGIRKGHAILIEGVCIQEVMKRIRLVPNLKVYLRKVDSSGIWHDGLKLDPSKTAEQVITQERESIQKLAAILGEEHHQPDECLSFEIIRYHYAWQPHKTSDLYFDRVELPARETLPHT